MRVNRGRYVNRDPAYTARLASEILASISINTSTGCWVWIKSFQRNGYGQKRAYGIMMPAHRASWIAFRGNVTDGLEVAHCCGNRKCVNPAHLKELIHAQNMRERHISGNDGGRPVFLHGIEYRSVAQAAQQLGITRSAVRYRERKQKGCI